MSYLVLFDLDDTIINGQSQKLLVKYLFKKGKISIFFLIYIYSWFFLYKIGLVKDVIKIREKSFKICRGWSFEYMYQLLDSFFYLYIKPRFYKEILDIIKFHKENGANLILISSSLFPLVELIGRYLSFDYIFATKLNVENGFYTGQIDDIVIYGDNKKSVINDFIKDNDLSLKNSYAYSDHYSDVELLNMVDNSIVINPDRKLLEVALFKKWKIKKIKN
jgi:HAD superfamily hydrolase (TIGR01490 family)